MPIEPERITFYKHQAQAALYPEVLFELKVAVSRVNDLRALLANVSKYCPVSVQDRIRTLREQDDGKRVLEFILKAERIL